MRKNFLNFWFNGLCGFLEMLKNQVFDFGWKAAKEYFVPLTAVSISLLGVSSYFYYKTLIKRHVASQKDRKPYHIVDNEVFYEVEVPKESVPLVIGKNGAKIQEIMELAKVLDIRKIVDNKDPKCVRVYFLIRSESITKCRYAKFLIEKAYEGNVEETVFIVKRLVSSLIGVGGDNIKKLQSLTKTRLKIDECRRNKRDQDIVPVIIRGLKDDIEKTKYILRIWLLRLDNGNSQQIDQRTRDYSYRRLANVLSNYEKLDGNSTKLQKVEVSARIGPDCFYVKKMYDDDEPTFLEIQRLERELNEYYGLSINRANHAVSANRLLIGQIVIVQSRDGKYYRGKLLMKEGGDFIFIFLDFGDDESINCAKCFEIIPRFLEVPFQAIQCHLANVKPKESDSFSSLESGDYFDEISKCGTKTPVFIRVSHSIPLGRDANSQEVYCVDITYFEGNQEINVSKKMIDKGFAIGYRELEDYLPITQQDISEQKIMAESESKSESEAEAETYLVECATDNLFQNGDFDESILVTPDIGAYLNESVITCDSSFNGNCDLSVQNGNEVTNKWSENDGDYDKDSVYLIEYVTDSSDNDDLF